MQTSRRAPLTRFSAAAVLGLLTLPYSRAELPDRQHPKLSGHPQTLSNGVLLKVTPRGEEFFKQHLDMILQSMSFYPDQGFFPKIDRALNIADTDEDRARIQTVQSTIETFIKGLKVNTPTPRLSFEKVGYNARITKLALSVDRLMTHARGMTNGAVLMLDLEADQIAVDLEKVSMSDPANEWAGSAGLTQLQLTQKADSIPLHARAWLEVTTDPNTYVSNFKVIKINSSLSGMNLEYQVEGIDLPELAIHINGRRLPVSRAYLNGQLTQKKVQILEGLRIWLGDLVSETLPTSLNKVMEEYFKGEFGNTTYIKPPGSPKGTAGVREFIMTFISNKLSTQNGIHVQLASRVWDPLNPDSPVNRRWSAAPEKAPQMNTLPDHDYDLAISINKGLVNHLIQLSYERGYFKNVPLNTGSTATLTASPIIETVPMADGKVDPKRFRIWIQGKFKSTGFQGILLKNWYDLAFEVTGSLVPNPKGPGLLFACEYVNPRTLKFPDSNYNHPLGKFLHPGILPIVKGIVDDFNEKWTTTPLLFEQTVPLPPSFFGLEMQLNQYEMDPAGFMTMYLTLPQGDASW